MNRILAAFSAARSENRGALVVYVCAGDPSLEVTRDVVLAIAQAGADVVELGIPYTDPVADGPTIQAAARRALEGGTRVAGVLECAAQIRAQSQVPLVVMSSISPTFRFGLDRFAAEAKASGIDGVLFSDLPIEESGPWQEAAAAREVGTVFLVAPSTPQERMKRIAQATTGFVYAVARAGTTGAREKLPEELPAMLQRLRTTTDKPIAVGFGISTPEQVRTVCSLADGAIVGSAVVKTIAEAADPAAAAAELVGKLAEGKR